MIIQLSSDPKNGFKEIMSLVSIGQSFGISYLDEVKAERAVRRAIFFQSSLFPKRRWLKWAVATLRMAFSMDAESLQMSLAYSASKGYSFRIDTEEKVIWCDISGTLRRDSQ